MAETRKLTKFAAEPVEDGFQLHIEAEGLEPMTLEATREQIDAIADALDDRLAETDDEDLADDVQEESDKD